MIRRLGRCGAAGLLGAMLLLPLSSCEKDNTPAGKPTGAGASQPTLAEQAAESVSAAARSTAQAVDAAREKVADAAEKTAEAIQENTAAAREAAADAVEAAAEAARAAAEQAGEALRPEQPVSPPKPAEPGAATLARAHEALTAAHEELDNFKQVKPHVPEGMTAIYDVMVVEFEKQIKTVAGQVAQAEAGDAETFNRLDGEIIPRTKTITEKMREFGRRFTETQPVTPPATPNAPR